MKTGPSFTKNEKDPKIRKVMLSKLIKAGLIFLSAVFISEGVNSQALSFNLKEAQDFAVKNSYNVRNAQFDLDIARKTIKESLSYGFPQIDATVDYSYFIAIPTQLIPAEFMPGGEPGEFIELQFGLKNNFTGGITLNKLIFDGRFFIGLDYARIFEQVSM